MAALQDSLEKSAHSELALFALYWLNVTFPCGIVHFLVMIRLRVVFYQNREICALDETAVALSLVSSLFSSLVFHLLSSLSSFIFSGLSSSLFSCRVSPFSSSLVFHLLSSLFIVVLSLLFHLLLPSLSCLIFSCLSFSVSLSLSLCLSVSVSVLVCCGTLKKWKKPCVDSKTPPCEHSKRPRVYRHHAHMCFNMCAWCRYKRGRFERTHGDVLNPHTGSRGSSSVLLTKICSRTVITCFRSSPKKLLNLSYFQV